jgi:hypothetical protein
MQRHIMGFTISPGGFRVNRVLTQFNNKSHLMFPDRLGKAHRRTCDQSPSLPDNTVTDDFGRIYLVLALPVIVERAAGPSGSAVPPLMLECH